MKPLLFFGVFLAVKPRRKENLPSQKVFLNDPVFSRLSGIAKVLKKEKIFIEYYLLEF